jgi:anti-sigma B factor antagonist
MSERSIGDVIVIDLVGALTSNDAAELHEAMSRLLARGHKKIVFDLARLTYIDSLGLGELVACQLRAIKNDQSLRLANADSRVQDVLLVTQLITVFDAYDSLESALESF